MGGKKTVMRGRGHHTTQHGKVLGGFTRPTSTHAGEDGVGEGIAPTRRDG